MYIHIHTLKYINIHIHSHIHIHKLTHIFLVGIEGLLAVPATPTEFVVLFSFIAGYPYTYIHSHIFTRTNAYTQIYWWD